MTVAEEEVKWKVRLWSQGVDRYSNRNAALEENKGALYAVLMNGVSKIIMERIMKTKQEESTKEDFLKQVQKELKVYEKHGGDFLWGDAQDTELAERV